jgi:diaminohydroxyphosphoribosylaminopyrimidine deaminase/5-amino-6-(5-phosphoribosylamino)uracil reductase
MAAALRLGERGRDTDKKLVGCMHYVVEWQSCRSRFHAARWRPHAEAMALQQQATQPLPECLRKSGTMCAYLDRPRLYRALLIDAKPAEIIVAIEDPDPRTKGKGALP